MPQRRFAETDNFPSQARPDSPGDFTMHITALRLTAREAQLVPEEEVTRFLRRPQPAWTPETAPGDDGHWDEHWLDLADAGEQAWGAFLEALNLPESDRDVGMENRNFPQAEILTDGGVALRLPVRNAWTDERSVYINMVLLKNTLITQHDGELAPLEKVRRHLLEGDRPDIDTMPGLMLYVLEGIMETGVNDFIQARAQVEAQSDLLEANPNEADEAPIRHLKHAVEHLSSQVEEQLFCVTLLRGLLPHNATLAGIHDSTAELLDALAHVQRSLQRLESRLGDLLQQIDARLRSRTEQRLRVLTVVSTVFMPLTFITGFYGMNFTRMPVVSAPWGYPLVVGCMIALGVGMVLFFRWRGWFK